MKTQIFITTILSILFLASFTSALTLNSVNSDTFLPGQTGTISLEIENNLEDDADDVSIVLNLQNIPFTPIGSSESSVEEIEEDEEEDFSFTLKAANDIIPGDYKIPFTLTYFINGEMKQRTGSIGVTTKANSDLTFSITQQDNIVGQDGRITLKIINKGFGDAKFALVKIFPEGFTLKSDAEIYIGTIDSDDFETATFDIIYKEKNPTFTATVEYKDFDNKKMLETVNLPLTVYTTEEAIELGIIKKNNTPVYIGVIVILVVLWLIYRTIRKRMRANRKKKQGR